jgi:hypothetical protein
MKTPFIDIYNPFPFTIVPNKHKKKLSRCKKKTELVVCRAFEEPAPET